LVAAAVAGIAVRIVAVGTVEKTVHTSGQQSPLAQVPLAFAFPFASACPSALASAFPYPWPCLAVQMASLELGHGAVAASCSHYNLVGIVVVVRQEERGRMIVVASAVCCKLQG